MGIAHFNGFCANNCEFLKFWVKAFDLMALLLAEMQAD
jgi:hypothetical protein